MYLSLLGSTTSHSSTPTTIPDVIRDNEGVRTDYVIGKPRNIFKFGTISSSTSKALIAQHPGQVSAPTATLDLPASACQLVFPDSKHSRGWMTVVEFGCMASNGFFVSVIQRLKFNTRALAGTSTYNLLTANPVVCPTLNSLNHHYDYYQGPQTANLREPFQGCAQASLHVPLLYSDLRASVVCCTV